MVNTLGINEIESKIVTFLGTHPPTHTRRAWFNVAFNIGMRRDESVKATLDKLVEHKVVFRQSVGKGHRYALTAGFEALR